MGPGGRCGPVSVSGGRPGPIKRGPERRSRAQAPAGVAGRKRAPAPKAGSGRETGASARPGPGFELSLKSPDCYTFAALQSPPRPMLRPDPTRRAAFALPLLQSGVGLAGAAVLAMFAGGSQAAAFLAGVMVVAAGFAIFAWRTAGRSPVASAARSFARLLVGAVLKWLVIGVGVALAMASPVLPAGFVLAGVLIAFLTYLLSLPWLLR
jgi:hypothetical protein